MEGGGETGNANGKTARQFSCQLLPHPPTLQQGISGCRSDHVYFVQPSIILSHLASKQTMGHECLAPVGSESTLLFYVMSVGSAGG